MHINKFDYRTFVMFRVELLIFPFRRWALKTDYQILSNQRRLQEEVIAFGPNLKLVRVSNTSFKGIFTHDCCICGNIFFKFVIYFVSFACTQTDPCRVNKSRCWRDLFQLRHPRFKRKQENHFWGKNLKSFIFCVKHLCSWRQFVKTYQMGDEGSNIVLCVACEGDKCQWKIWCH